MQKLFRNMEENISGKVLVLGVTMSGNTWSKNTCLKRSSTNGGIDPKMAFILQQLESMQDSTGCPGENPVRNILLQVRDQIRQAKGIENLLPSTVSNYVLSEYANTFGDFHFPTLQWIMVSSQTACEPTPSASWCSAAAARLRREHPPQDGCSGC